MTTVGALFFASGATALIYQVLWLRELALLFGNGAQASATTLAAFFAGIAAGNAYWGKRSAAARHPLQSYGWLEIGVALSAVLYFGILALYGQAYGLLYSSVGEHPTLFLGIKFALAVALLFPAAFLMGGTLPMIIQHAVDRKEVLGTRGANLYALNTLGGAVGAIAAGIVLPRLLGFTTTYLLNMVITLLIGITAMTLGRQATAAYRTSTPEHRSPKGAAASPERLPVLLAALSGFTTLGLQVLWVRQFAQVVHNSVYTYSIILVVFLVALALGGALARWCARQPFQPNLFLASLLALAGSLVVTSPMMFSWLTNAGGYVGADAAFPRYILQIGLLTAAVIGPPVTVLGMVLPSLFNVVKEAHHAPGEAVARLVTANTLAAIAGSLTAGFILLGWLGLHLSLMLMGVLYLAASLALLLRSPPTSRWPWLAPAAGLALVLISTVDEPAAATTPAGNQQEVVLETWEGPDATVAVVSQGGFLRTKMNNWYTLGSTGDVLTQQVQTHLPMLLHPNPSRVFYLGMGTGITAGTALDYPVNRVLVAEIAPSVIRASQKYFTEHTNGLYTDPRVRILAEDGRNALRGVSESFDLIIADLFVPWRAGVGALYSVDHFELAKQRMDTEGLYVQWLPLYQMTSMEFSIIAQSMLEVFPWVTVWRANFWADRPVVALVGHRSQQPLALNVPLVLASRAVLAEHAKRPADRVPLVAHYVGGIPLEDHRIQSAPLNTDNHAVIEYLAPINHRRERAGLVRWLDGDEWLTLTAAALQRDVLAEDRFLSNLDHAWHDVIQAGYYLQTHYHLKAVKPNEAPAAKRAYDALLKRAAANLAH